jgi:predicted RecB family nuclease
MVTNDIFISHLNCRRKGHLKGAGRSGEPHDFETVQLGLDRVYRTKALAAFLGPGCEDRVVHAPPSLEAALLRQPRVIVDAVAEADGICSHIHALEWIGGTASAYAPILFVRNEKVTRHDKLLLAFNALALSQLPSAARIIHGAEHKVLRVKVQPLLGEVRGEIRAIQAEQDPPKVTLNAHCSVCEFRNACRREAEEADDLSLLRGIATKELENHRKRGVATVTQFSYTYRPGRRGKRRTGKARKHDHALQALAIREKKVYVLDSPVIPQSGVALYLDIEGIPDLGFEYLFGLLAVKDGVCSEFSFWADDPSQEKVAWADCLRVIEGFGDYTLYHYGQYELRFLDRIINSAGSDEAAAVARIKARTCNVLAAIYSHIYFPTWSNGLKDVGTFLGASWSAPNASGVQSIAWRLAWEESKDEATRQLLLAYNREDCMALRRVTEFVLSVCGDGASMSSRGGPPVASVDDIYRAGFFRFGKTKFFCPELDHINKCAYSDYQRDKVYLRTSPAVRKSQRRKHLAGRKRLKENEVIECGGPQSCPKCGRVTVCTKNGNRNARLLCYDLRFTSSGVKRWLVRYTSSRYSCVRCGKTFYASAYRAVMKRIGNNLASWVIYQHVALRLSYEDVRLSLIEIFGFQFTHTVVGRVKPLMGGRHQPTYQRLKDKLRQGFLIHGDETRVRVKGRPGYVWAFTNLEEVVYVYTPTREGTILEEMLEGFDGVLVSDFYSAYDSPRCKQQKCLIHLIRDVNDDLLHNPFDEEMKQLAQKLVGLLKPIIDTIDRYGLKKYHLNKHKDEVTRYFRYLSEKTFKSEVARKYQKRLQKYRDKLFVFLDHDSIPWNNNNAENAIKLFASRRKLIGSSFTEKGLKNYLIFLSIFQTCRNKNLSFLGFLRSGLFDIDAFADARRM